MNIIAGTARESGTPVLHDKRVDAGTTALINHAGRHPVGVLCALASVALWPAVAVQAADAASDSAGPAATTGAAGVPQVVIIGTTPLAGAETDPDKIPSNVQTLGADDLDPDHRSDLLPTAMARRMASVNLNDEQGSPYQPDFVFRGFEASPISGVAEGLAVYQNGTRINEALGDSVNWDLVPQFAVRRVTVQADNPVFGLNALGGAVTMDMKNGFNSPGTTAELSGGSFGNVTGNAAYGLHDGSFGFYGAIGGVKDDGFRYVSPTHLRQAYGDAGYESGAATLHLSVSLADNDIGAVGPTPVQMLAANPRSVFTYPQSMQNQMQLVQLNGTLRATDALLLSLNTYHRYFRQHLIDGNTTDVQACDNDADYFCLEGNNQYPQDALYDARGTQVPTSVLPAGATPGETDHTGTSTATSGIAAQATVTTPLFGLANHLSLGLSADHSDTSYAAYGELGTLLPSLEVAGSGTIIDQGLSDTASPPIEEPVSIRATTDYYGAWFIDALDLGSRLTWTLSGRYNRADLALHDLLGTALDSSNRYSRFNPGTGFTYKITPALTAYAGYSEANRAPTAAELSCANPTSPCLLDAFLVSDPPLKQVVSRTIEAGLRGHLSPGPLPGQLHWYFNLYRTTSSNDIILLATQINGFGYFANAGTTRRQGLETGLSWKLSPWSADLTYTLLDATYRDALTLSSNSPATDANGNIYVHPGDRIPLMPEHRITAALDYAPAPRWTVGADARYTSNQYLVGDDSNQEPQLPASIVVNLHGSYQLSGSLQLFAAIDNVFNRIYYTYGTFTQLDGLPPNFNLTDPRTYSPSPPRTFYGGIRLAL